MSPLTATYRHPEADRWSRPGGPWSDDSLDAALPTAGQLEQEVAAIAGGLAAAGVRAGSTVSWKLPNGAAPDRLFRATWRLGATACPIHHLAGEADTAAALERLAPAVFVDHEAQMPTGSPIGRGAVDVDPDSVAVALGTAGSTGRPKLALHSHRSLVYKARLMTATHRLGPDDCVLLPVPLAHISGLLNGVLISLSGLRVVPVARWDAAEALALIEQEAVTFMVGPPVFFVSMIDSPSYTPRAVRSLRQISCGGAGVTASFVLGASEALDCRVKRSYGSTEAPTVTTSTLDDPPERAAYTDGRPFGDVELRIVDTVSSLELPDGQRGELWLRGPELFSGYDDPEPTAAAFADGGWFRTGDLATRDADGWLTIVGRLKDVIIRGGENISTGEIESVLEAHPDVRQAVVVGYPDLRLGERVCGFVTARRPFGLDECRRWFDQQGVTRFKWPERVEQLTEIPELPSGKPDRAALRRLLDPAV